MNGLEALLLPILAQRVLENATSGWLVTWHQFIQAEIPDWFAHCTLAQQSPKGELCEYGRGDAR